MRFHMLLPRRKQIACAVERSEPHAEPCEGIGATLLPVDDTHGVAYDEAGPANGLHRIAEGAARRDHVLDEAHELTRLVCALDAVPGAVSLGFTAHDDEGASGRHCCRSSQRDRSEGRSRKPDSIGLRGLRRRRETLAELSQEARVGLEPVLVEVPARPLSRAKGEVTLEERDVEKPPAELVDGRHRRPPTIRAESPTSGGSAAVAHMPAPEASKLPDDG